MLARQGIQSLLVEGGATHPRRLHRAPAWSIGSPSSSRRGCWAAGVPIAAGLAGRMEKAVRLGPLAVRTVGDDLLITGDVVQAKRSR